MNNKIMRMIAASVLGAALIAGCTNTEAPAEDVTNETEDAPVVADELTFEDLQANYAILSECYEKAEDLYMNSAVAQDDEIEKLLNQARGIIDEMGVLKEDDFESAEDMSEFNDSMASMIDSLSAVVDKMQVADTDSDESAE